MPYTWTVVCGACGWSDTGSDIGLIELAAEAHQRAHNQARATQPLPEAPLW